MKSALDAVSLVTITPTFSTTLSGGASVDVTVQLSYTLDSHDRANVSLMEQTSTGSRGFGSATVNRGQGMVEITGTVTASLPTLTLGVNMSPPTSLVQQAGFACHQPLSSVTLGMYQVE
ncbi:MAG: hypothetical protein V3S31_05235 [Dehalococcoidia bacterium]